jgi:hypothetical protein
MDSFICEAKVTDIALSWITFLLVIVTAGLVWVGFRQEAQTRQLTRANVFVVSVNLGNITNPIPIEGYPPIIPTGAELRYLNVGPIVQLIIKNLGQTVAYDVVTWTNICLLEYPLISKLLPPPDEARRATSKSAIPPQGGTTKFNRFPRPLTDDEIAALRAEKMAIYVYGETTYRDGVRKAAYDKIPLHAWKHSPEP